MVLNWLRSELIGRYYLRIHVRDEEGVLAKISDILAGRSALLPSIRRNSKMALLNLWSQRT